MSGHYSFVTRADRVRCRAEDNGNYLLYNPRTDQLHIVDDTGKRIFDLCDGRSIDDVINDARDKLLGSGKARSAEEILHFICALKQRNLVVMR